MKLSTRWGAVFALALLASVSTLNGCGTTDPDVVFVREDLDLNGEPRQILKVISEDATIDVAYFNGRRWIVVPDVTVPGGWLIVSPALAEPEDVPQNTSTNPEVEP